MSMLHTIILLIAIAIILVSIALRLRIPYPVALVIGGAAIGFIPIFPEIHFDPNLLLSTVLPPILFYAAFGISFKEFKHEFFDILWLALGLVIVTTVVAGCLFKWLFPELPWALAFTFGAIVSPPDAVSATTILKKFSINRHLLAVLEGESLVNDATGLVLYKIGVIALLSGTFSFAEASLEFLKVGLGGIAIGVLTGYAFHLFSSRFLSPILGVIYSFLIPYATYLIADAIGVSGVLAVVVNGLIGSRMLVTHFSSITRIAGWVSWDIFIILLNCFVFILIGLQLHGIVQRLTIEKAVLYFGYSILITLALIAVRFVWVFTRQALLYLRGKESPHDIRNGIILSWSGMRGIVSMAAALALPYGIPGRDTVLFMTFAVIFLTLIVPGLTLSKLMTLLKVHAHHLDDATDIRSKLTESAKKELKKLHSLQQINDAEYEVLETYFKSRYQILFTCNEHRLEEARQHIIKKKREMLIDIWEETELSDELFQRIERELDLEEAPIARAEI